MSTLSELTHLLRERGGFEVVDSQTSPSQLRLEGRVPPNASSHWILIVNWLLAEMTKQEWKVDVSKRYFNRDLPSGSKTFYSWRLIFQAEKVEEQLPRILATVSAAPRPARIELQEFPLPGGGAQRNEHRNGKGAGSVDRVPLGPMAATAALRR